jgi:type IV secretion system protein TrbI
MADERKPTGATPGPDPQRPVRPTPPGGPSGMDLNPKPEPTRRVSKRGGMIVMGVLLVIVTLIVYGIFTRGKGPLAKEPQTKAKRLGAATASGDQMADNLLKQSKNRKGSDDAEPDSGDDLKAPPLSSRVRPGSSGGASRQQNGAQVLSAAEQAREKAYKDEEDARNAPMSINGGSNSGGLLGGAHGASNSLVDALKNDASLASLLRGSAGGAGGPGQATPPLQDDQNKQNDKESFLEKARSHPEDMYLKSSRVNPLTRYEIKAGWDIPATLEQAVNSDLPGEIKALVRSNVYDTASGRYLLIPQGSRLIGTYNHRVAYGQNAVQVIWTRLIYPDGTSINLQGMVGQDAQGQSGFRDKVDNHYARLIGFALLTSAFSAGIQLSQNQQTSSFAYPSTSQIATQALGQQLGELGMEVTRRNLNIQPTIKIRVGYRFNVRVNKDIAFEEPYSPIAD